MQLKVTENLQLFNPQMRVTLPDFQKRIEKDNLGCCPYELSAYLKIFKSIGERLNLPEGIDVLEVGAGEGRLGGYFFTSPNVKKYAGLEPNSSYRRALEDKFSGARIYPHHLLEHPAEHRYHVVCLPFMTLPMFPASLQQMLMLKCMTHLLPGGVCIIDTMLPEAYNIDSPIVLHEGWEEGVLVSLPAWCLTQREMLSWLPQGCKAYFETYNFLWSKERGQWFPHQLVIFEKG